MPSVFYDDQLPNGFEEHFFYSSQMPYTLNIKHFQAEDIVPLHYAKTIELLWCDGLCGEIVIGSNHYTLSEKQMFVIPPYTVHANHVRPGEGCMYVLKIHFQEMGRYLNIPELLSAGGCQISRLCYSCPEYASTFVLVEKLIAFDGELARCVALLLELFLLLSRYTDNSRAAASVDRFRESSLQELIRWTNENYARKITIDEVAAITGYSKYHFCSRFKALTGMTYMRYLNSVRVSHACLMLRNGDSVQTVCRNTGFENTSHFIQIFKGIQHVTPYQYAREQKKLMT